MNPPRTARRFPVPHRYRFVGRCLLLLFIAACSADDEPKNDEPKSDTECAGLSGPLPAVVPDAAGRVVGEPTDQASPIYDQSVLQTFELKLDDSALAILDADPSAEKYVSGKLVFAGQEYGPVGIRYKGSLGAWIFCVANSTPQDPLNIGGAKTCPKLSMKISFNEYDPKGEFFGVKKLLFHSLNNDDSLMKERLGYWLYRQMGVPASRAVHMRLLINGKYQGVFLNVEDVDGRFTHSHFADGDGNLYKEIWPTYIDGLTSPPTPDALHAALETNKDSPVIDKFLAFGKAVMTEGGDERARALRDWLSISNSARFTAVDRTIRADDGPFHFYCQQGHCLNHNFFIYEEQKASRLWLIPWDLDTSFVVTGSLGGAGDSTLHVINEWDDHTVSCQPVPGGGNPNLQQVAPACDPLWNGLGCYFIDSYHAALAELLAGPFSESVVNDNIAVWQAQIAAAVKEANLADDRQLAPQAWQDALDNFRERTRALRSQAAR